MLGIARMQEQGVIVQVWSTEIGLVIENQTFFPLSARFDVFSNNG